MHLRGYKAIFPELQGPFVEQDANLVPSAFMRYYLEYAPYGTLANLLARYKASNRYLPELFLWHVFNSLAKALLVLEQGTANRHVETSLIHFDIKPENIFLGYEAAKSSDPDVTGGLDGEIFNYPSIKLADFGLARVFVEDTEPSMEEIGARGTPTYFAPVSRMSSTLIFIADNLQEIVCDEGVGQYGANWTHPPNLNTSDQVQSELDVWNVGRVMFEAFSLLPNYMYNRIKAQSSLQYERNGRKAFLHLDEAFGDDSVHPRSPYTKRLSDVIEMCMHVEPSDRPTAVALYRITRDAMNRCIADSESTLPFSVRNRKLYYVGNEINNMPFEEKNCGKRLETDEYLELLHPANNDPEDEALKIYPEQMWETYSLEGDRVALREEYRRKADQQMRDEFGFRSHLHRNSDRVTLQPGSGLIDISDRIDRELTYGGTADDQFFIDESIRKYGPLRQAGDRHGNGNDDNNNGNNNGGGNDGNGVNDERDGDDDDNNDDDNNNDGRGAVLSKRKRDAGSRRGNKATSGAVQEKAGPSSQAPDAGRPTSQGQEEKGGALDDQLRKPNHPPRFSVHIPHIRKHASERDWVNGSGREHVGNFEPYITRKGKGRAASSTELAEAVLEEVRRLSECRVNARVSAPLVEDSLRTSSASMEDSVATDIFGAEMFRPNRPPKCGQQSKRPREADVDNHGQGRPGRRPRLSQIPKTAMEKEWQKARVGNAEAGNADSWLFADWE